MDKLKIQDPGLHNRVKEKNGMLIKDSCTFATRNPLSVLILLNIILILISNGPVIVLGAAYNGRNAADASRVIDASQGVSGHAHYPRGHPRGHASHPGASDSEGSVENYSRGGQKSGFENRNAQDVTANAALTTQLAQDAMRRLNEGSTRESLTIPKYELSNVENVRMAEWTNGERRTEWSQFRSVTIVLQHHNGQQNNPNYDVHVHTFYPRGR